MLALRPSYADTHLRLRPSYAESAAEITVVTDIEAGNVDSSTVVITEASSETPTIWADVRSSSKIYPWRHFLFAVENAEGKRPLFKFARARKMSPSTTPTTHFRPWWTQDFVTWTQAPSRTLVGGSSGTIEWQFTDPLPSGRVYIASHPLGRQTEVESYAAFLLASYPAIVSPTSSADENGVYYTTPAETDDIDRAVGGNPMYALKFSWGGSTTDGQRKRKLVLLAQTHAAGESPSFVVAQRFMDFLLSSEDAAAVALRANFDVYFYLNVFPNSVVGGSYRYPFRSSVDPNRDWYLAPTSSALAEIDACRAAIVADTGGTADAMLSWHGFGNLSDNFICGVPEVEANAGTRSAAMQAFFDAGTTLFGSAPNLQTAGSGVTNNQSYWGFAQLGTTVCVGAEYGLNGASMTQQQIGEAWARTLQAVDAQGLVLPPVDLAGASMIATTSTGSLTTGIPLAAASLIATTATGSLSTGIALEGSASSVTLADGVLTIGIRLRGDALSQAIASAGLTTAIQLAADAQASAQAAGALTTQPAGMAADATVAALATGSLTVHIRIAADAVAQVLAQADLTVPGAPAELEAHASVLAIAEGGLITAIRLEGAAASFAQADGTLDMALTMRADAFVQAMASGVLSTQIRMDAAAVASAIAAASLTTSGAPLAAHGARRATFRGYQRITSRRPRQYA